MELREGKFFVTRAQLKDNDVILDNPTVSTPHCMASVSAEGGLLFQDLMSGEGFFVRRKDSESFVREDHIVRVEHGDTVRFGSVEFLIALIPSAQS